MTFTNLSPQNDPLISEVLLNHLCTFFQASLNSTVFPPHNQSTIICLPNYIFSVFQAIVLEYSDHLFGQFTSNKLFQSFKMQKNFLLPPHYIGSVLQLTLSLVSSPKRAKTCSSFPLWWWSAPFLLIHLTLRSRFDVKCDYLCTRLFSVVTMRK